MTNTKKRTTPEVVCLEIDPSVLSTAQQKIMNYKTKCIITNPKVKRAMRIVRSEARVHRLKVRSVSYEDGKPTAVTLRAYFCFPFPKSLTKRERAKMYEGYPVVSAHYGDLDNRNKAFQDALVEAGWFEDDRYISHLDIRKVYSEHPRIHIEVERDTGWRLPI